MNQEKKVGIITYRCLTSFPPFVPKVLPINRFVCGTSQIKLISLIYPALTVLMEPSEVFIGGKFLDNSIGNKKELFIGLLTLESEYSSHLITACN